MSNQAYYVGYTALEDLFEGVQPPVTVYLKVNCDRRLLICVDVQWIDVAERTVNYWRHQIGRVKETNGSQMQVEANVAVLNCAESLRRIIHEWLRDLFRDKGDWKLKDGTVAVPRDLELVPAEVPSFAVYNRSERLYSFGTVELAAVFAKAMASVIGEVVVVPLIPPANEERQMGQFRA